MRYVLVILLLVVAGAGGWLLGNQSGQQVKTVANNENVIPTVETPTISVVRGIGKLEPKGGVYKIFAPQGERVDSLFGLDVGDRVNKKQPIVRLASHEFRRLELEIAEAKKKDAQNQLAFEQSKGGKKKEAAQLAIQEAGSLRNQVFQKSKVIDLLRSQLSAANRQLTRLQNLKANRLTATMVGTTDIEKQNLLIDQIEAKITEAENEVEFGANKAERAEKAAQLELESIDLMIKGSGANLPVNSLDGAIAAAEKALELTVIKAPIAGDVLDVVVRQGDTVTTQPVLLMGDTNNMVCIAEINDVNFRYVGVGNKATISSLALEAPIEGEVISLGKMIGSPSMQDPNPFAGVDRKTGRVVIELKDSTFARNFVNLQVDVEIALQKQQDDE